MQIPKFLHITTVWKFSAWEYSKKPGKPKCNMEIIQNSQLYLGQTLVFITSEVARKFPSSQKIF
jgi:hypothetical protein